MTHLNCNTLSVFKITAPNQFAFSADIYSQFKYGSLKAAELFGRQLAETYCENLLTSDQYHAEQLVVIPSAYSHIPTASYYMTQFFIQHLNHYLYLHQFPLVEQTKIYRSVSYREDYGAMTASDRYNLISKDEFYIDQSFLNQKRLIFIDDIKITGTHERVILNMLHNKGITNPIDLLYFAELTNPEIHPNIENILNHHSINNLDQINELIQKQDFAFNTRVIKFILNSTLPNFKEFIARQNSFFVHQLYYNAISNEYYKFDAYQETLAYLKKSLEV